MQYFTRDALRRGEAHWTSALDAYRKHFAAIAPRLSPNILALHRVSFHDQVIDSIERPAAGVVALHTDTCDIFFQGVSKLQVGSNLHGDVWLYDEIGLRKDGKTQLSILLEQGEITIVFETVFVFDKSMRKWSVPPYRVALKSKQKEKRDRKGRKR